VYGRVVQAVPRSYRASDEGRASATTIRSPPIALPIDEIRSLADLRRRLTMAAGGWRVAEFDPSNRATSDDATSDIPPPEPDVARERPFGNDFRDQPANQPSRSKQLLTQCDSVGARHAGPALGAALDQETLFGITGTLDLRSPLSGRHSVSDLAHDSASLTLPLLTLSPARDCAD